MKSKYHYKVLYLDAITEDQLERAIEQEIIPFLNYHGFTNQDKILKYFRLIFKYTYLSPNQISKGVTDVKISFITNLGYPLHKTPLNVNGEVYMDNDLNIRLKKSCPQHIRKLKFEKLANGSNKEII